MSFNLQSVPTAGLSQPQIQALAGLSAGLTIAEIARDLNISRQTIYNWQKDPKFVSALNVSRQLVAEDLRDQMLVLSRKALKRLETLIDDPKTPPSVALRAALAVLTRPQFPEKGWTLPAHINTPREDQIHQTLEALEIEEKQLEIANQKRKLAAAQAKTGQNWTPNQPSTPPPVHPTVLQNLTQNQPPANAAGR